MDAKQPAIFAAIAVAGAIAGGLATHVISGGPSPVDGGAPVVANVAPVSVTLAPPHFRKVQSPDRSVLKCKKPYRDWSNLQNGIWTCLEKESP